MKRLLAYLFIALGFWLIFSVKAISNSGYICIEQAELKTDTVRDNSKKKEFIEGLYWLILHKNKNCTYEISEKISPKSFKKFKNQYKWASSNISLTTNEIILATSEDRIFSNKNNSLIIDGPYLCFNYIDGNLKSLSVTKFKKLIKNRNCELKIFRGNNKEIYQRFVNISFYEDTNQIFPWEYKEDSTDKNIAWRRAVLTQRVNKIIDDFNKVNTPEIEKFGSSQTQIAKAEPSQTQKVVEKVKTNKLIKKIDLLFCQSSNGFLATYTNDSHKNCPSWGKEINGHEWAINNNQSICVKDDTFPRRVITTKKSCDFFNMYEAKYNGSSYDYTITNVENLKNNKLKIYKAYAYGDKTGNNTNQLFLGVSDKNLEIAKQNALNNCKLTTYGNSVCKIHSLKLEKIIKDEKTVITKAEPDQTQNTLVSDKNYFCLVGSSNSLDNFYYFPINNFANFKKKVSNFSKFKNIEPHNVNQIRKLCDRRIYKDKDPIKFQFLTLHYGGFDFDKLSSDQYSYGNFNRPMKENYFLNYYEVDNVINGNPAKIVAKANDFIKSSESKIAKNEKNITPLKKIEVAKVEESKQEEFKPKKTNQDKDPPVIEIAQNITVSDTSYVIEGKVSDKSEKIFVEIDGQPIEVNKGKFKANRYSPVDEQIEIVAIDQWGNRSKTKIVNIKIDLKQTKVASKIEPLNPSNLKTKTDKNKVALIIGVEKYENSPSAKYASLDAKYFKDYARKAFGVRDDNINLLTDEDANLSKTNSAIFKWLPSKIKKNKTDLIIFYSGHGLASADGKEKYILPHNADPDLLSRTAISRNDIFDQIVSLNPRSVTIFFDTCYSGVSRDEQMLLASARPLRIVADDENEIPNNFTLFSASANDQISSGLKNAKHGIFSYFLMKGLEGEADLDGDRKLTNGELITYLNENVSENALNLGRQQNPSLIGNSEKVLIRF